MRGSAFIIVSSAALVGIVGFFAWQIPSKMKYEELRDRLREVPHFATHPLDRDASAYLESVKDTWDVHDQECPDSIFADISWVSGFEESVAGVVAFHTHEIPAFSFFNHRRNAREAALAIAMAVALPISVDQRIYSGDGVCFIRLTEDLVEAFEDTEGGLQRTRYLNPKNGGRRGGSIRLRLVPQAGGHVDSPHRRCGRAVDPRFGCPEPPHPFDKCAGRPVRANVRT